MSSLFLKALCGENHNNPPPVWLMRQAGRYMKAYRDLREKHSFLELCTTPELIATVTEQPIKTFGFDAAIIFSDILLPLQALGYTLTFDGEKGPQIFPKVKNCKDIQALKKEAIAPALSCVYEGIHAAKERLTVPLIGFAAAPFTLASYLICGGAPKPKVVRNFFHSDPKLFRALLRMLTDYIIEHCNMQVLAGVDVVQIFESSAFLLNPEELRLFSYPYIKKILRLSNAPQIIFMRGVSLDAYLELKRLKPTALSVDYSVDVGAVRQKVPKLTLQGNLHPEVLLDDKARIKKQVKELMKKMAGDPAFIFNLGHGVLPATPESHVQCLVDTVRELGSGFGDL